MFETISRFIKHKSGNVFIVFSLAMPVLMVGVAGTIDYAGWLSTQAQMQTAADMAALAGAKEMRLANPDPAAIASAAQSRAFASLGAKGLGATVQAALLNNNTKVQVQIDQTAPSMFGGLAPAKYSHLHVQAVAQTSSSTPICLLSLDQTATIGVGINMANINSPGCGTYSDSKKPNGLTVIDGSIAASQTCSSGGYVGPGGSVTPAALTDCPILGNPLASRAPPPVGGCDFNGKVVSQGSETLYPGTYCGGLKITLGATAIASKGVYIIKDGPLVVDQDATLKGDQVGFYLTGATALLSFDFSSAINLTCPKNGALAGILFFEDPTSVLGRAHLLASRNAPQLLGTLYFPKGNLTVGSPITSDDMLALLNWGHMRNAPTVLSQGVIKSICNRYYLQTPCPPPTTNIAIDSAWTIVIANQIMVTFGVNLTLNSNYSATSTAPPVEIPMAVASLSK